MQPYRIDELDATMYGILLDERHRVGHSAVWRGMPVLVSLRMPVCMSVRMTVHMPRHVPTHNVWMHVCTQVLGEEIKERPGGPDLSVLRQHLTEHGRLPQCVKYTYLYTCLPARRNSPLLLSCLQSDGPRAAGPRGREARRR